MSGQTNQGSLPEPKVAYDHLFDTVHARVFFGRLAQRGIVPQNEKQASDLFALAGRLRNVAQAEKAASDQESPFTGALQALDGYLGQSGLGGSVKQAQAQERELAVKEAAAELAADPLCYNSVLSLKAYEAGLVAQQLQGQR